MNKSITTVAKDQLLDDTILETHHDALEEDSPTRTGVEDRRKTLSAFQIKRTSLLTDSAPTSALNLQMRKTTVKQETPAFVHK